MEWIINLIKTIFKKNKRKLIEAPKKEIKKEAKAKADFLIEIKITANLEQNDQNVYKIIKKYSLKDMV